MNGPTLVVGATGMLGGAVCRRLAAAGKPVRALVRSGSDPQRVEALRETGAETVLGDLKDDASLAGACNGAAAVITTAQTVVSRQPDDSIEAVDELGQLALVAAAEAAGVERFVYTSFSEAIDFPFPFQRAKRAVEARLDASTLTWTVLQPSCFMEVWFSPFLLLDAAGGLATVFGSGEQRISWISVEDVAEVAVRALDAPEAANAVLAFGGPDALSPREVFQIFEQELGRPLDSREVSIEQLEQRRKAASDPYEESLACLLIASTRDDPQPEGALGVAPVSVREFARRARS